MDADSEGGKGESDAGLCIGHDGCIVVSMGRDTANRREHTGGDAIEVDVLGFDIGIDGAGSLQNQPMTIFVKAFCYFDGESWIMFANKLTGR